MDGEPHRSFDFGPQLITLLGVLVGAVVVVSYQCLANGCCCNQRRRIRNNAQQTEQQQQQPLQINPNVHRPRGATTATTATTTTTTTTSDNENEVSASPAHQLMPNFKYSKECKKGICAVCLCEFKDGETIRVLPECMHFFHVGCIDTWLHSHSNCPLCRTDIVPPQPPQGHVVISMPNFSGIIQP